MSNIFADMEKAAQRVVNKMGAGVSSVALEQRISEYYRELGRLYYEASQRGETPQEAAVNPLMAQIRQLRAELDVKKNI
jgi:hypothetical protein